MESFIKAFKKIPLSIRIISIVILSFTALIATTALAMLGFSLYIIICYFYLGIDPLI